MASFNGDIIEQVVAACQAGLQEATRAFCRTFAEPAQLTVGDSGPLNIDPLPEEYHGGGLILDLRVGTEAALVLLPESSGLIPSWCRNPDATGKAKLATLAVEFGSLLLPESFIANSGSAKYVSDLGAALRRAKISTDAARVTIQVQGDKQSGVLSLIWPASQPEEAFNEFVVADDSASTPTVSASDWAANPALQAPVAGNRDAGAELPNSFGGESDAALHQPRQRNRISYVELEDGLAQLPNYSRSLLKIRVPVMVTLAEAKQPVGNVLDIGPGSIIHFNKPCEDTLALEIAGQKIALGEAVKVGDKFGLWITSMILPAERFWVLSNRGQTERAK